MQYKDADGNTHEVTIVSAAEGYKLHSVRMKHFKNPFGSSNRVLAWAVTCITGPATQDEPEYAIRAITFDDGEKALYDGLECPDGIVESDMLPTQPVDEWRGAVLMECGRLRKETA